jgi:Arc/MetJ-type ribon-helix-helix transcriptional regulator
MKTLQTAVPDKLYEKIMVLIDEGWYNDEKDIVNEALRRFLDTHKPEIIERLIREDVEWGLRGKD